MTKRTGYLNILILSIGLFTVHPSNAIFAKENKNIPGHFVDLGSIPLAELELKCISAPLTYVVPLSEFAKKEKSLSTSAFIGNILSEKCSVTPVERLCSTGKLELYSMKNQRTIRFQPEYGPYIGHAKEDEEPRSFDVEELIILESPLGSSLAKPVWFDSMSLEPESKILEYPKCVISKDGVFLELTYCLNGTGGCDQEYLFRANGKWNFVEQPFRQEAAAKLPTGYNFRVGIQINIDKLEATAPVYTKEDCNTCSSARIFLKLSFSDNRLMLKEFIYQNEKSQQRPVRN